MAMAGSVVTRDMKYNEIYAGSPAVSISHKIGFQFTERSIGEKMDAMRTYLEQYGSGDIRLVDHESQIDFSDPWSYFNVHERRYKKTGSEAEIGFMKFLLPEKAKFIPYEAIPTT